MSRSRLTTQQAELYRKALSGEVKLVGWGLRNSFPFHRWQEQYPLAFLIDTNFSLWDTRHEGLEILNPLALRDYAAQEHAVVAYYQSGAVTAYAKRVGGMTCLPPLPLQHLLRTLARPDDETKADNITPLSEGDRKRIIQNTPPFATRLEITQTRKDLFSSYDWQAFITSCLPSIPVVEQKEEIVVLACNSLYAGGAERQIVNCATGFSDRGWQTHFLATMNENHAPHYIQTLRDHNISTTFAQKDLNEKGKAFVDAFLKTLTPQVRAILWHLPIEYIAQIASTMMYFQQVRPRLVIAYLDWSNVIAGMAAVLSGVPEIIISGRSYAPPHYPNFFAHVLPTMREMHRILATCPNVHFTNNARAAATDYSLWLGLDPSKITTIPNCLTPRFLKPPKALALQRIRKELKIGRNDKIVLGIFRLSPEKRADKFLDILADLIKADNRVSGIICGDGDLREQLQKQAKQLGIEHRIQFLGVVDTVQEIMNCADILLHTAVIEGMPNVMIEAQSQGLPVVSQRIGGVLDCLAPALHDYCLELNDWAGMTGAALTLLKKPTLRKKLGAKARSFVRRSFSISRLIDRNLALTRYHKRPKKMK